MTRGASILITNAQNSLFLVLRRGRPGFAHQWRKYAGHALLKRVGRSIYHAWNDGVWSLPGGFAHGTESPRACAVRELAEETGLPCAAARMDADLRELHRFHLPFAFDWTVFHLHLPFPPSRWPDPHARDRHEYTESGWFGVDALPTPAHLLLDASVEQVRAILKRNRQAFQDRLPEEI